MPKVLHIIESFDGQAIENWLTRTFSYLVKNYDDTEWGFFCTQGKEGEFSEKIKKLGGKIYCAEYPISKPLMHCQHLRAVIRDGEYEVLHCHQDIMSAMYLISSLGTNISKRVVHTHNTTPSIPTDKKLKAVVLKWVFAKTCNRVADTVIGVSLPALASINGRQRGTDYKVVHCGIDLVRVGIEHREVLRSQLGIRSEQLVILFVGRMISYKNPIFILDIISDLRDRKLNVHAIFAGTGPLEKEVVKCAFIKDLTPHVSVLGFRDDVPQLMCASDILVWPGKEYCMEGLGLGVVEAQSAGLNVVMSQNVPKEAVIIKELISILPLSAGSHLWADEIAQKLTEPRMHQSHAQKIIEHSTFSVKSSAESVRDIHQIEI